MQTVTKILKVSETGSISLSNSAKGTYVFKNVLTSHQIIRLDYLIFLKRRELRNQSALIFPTRT